MTTSILVDSNVLIDILSASSEPRHLAWSQSHLEQLSVSGELCLSAIIWAEITQYFRDEPTLRRLLRPFDFQFEDLPFAAAFPAGQAHRRYRERGGRRERALPDFLIGAHAMVAGHRLLTRDPLRYRDYFPELDLIAPDTHP